MPTAADGALDATRQNRIRARDALLPLLSSYRLNAI